MKPQQWIAEGRPIEVDNPLCWPTEKPNASPPCFGIRTCSAAAASAPPSPGSNRSSSSRPCVNNPGTSRRVFLRGNPASAEDNGIINALLHADQLGFARRGIIDGNTARATVTALEQAGIRAARRTRRIGDYELGQMLVEGKGWQDFAAQHASTGVARRVRVYPYARAASPESRDRLARTAQREFKILEGVEHPGILRALDFQETELGPALIFEHDPSAARFDRFLAGRLDGLSLDQRLGLLRQLAEAIAYAHRKRLYHRGLAPQNILIRDTEGDRPRS